MVTNVHDHFREKLTAELQNRGISAKQLSEDAGLGATAVSDILNQKSKRPGLETVAAIARALDLAMDTLCGTNSRTLSVVMPMAVQYQGVVLAGQPSKQAYWSEPESVIFLMPASHKHPGIARFFLRVEGEAMDQVLDSGDFAVCATYKDLKTKPRNGDLVVCREVLDDQRRSLYLRQLVIDDDGESWLVNNSKKAMLSPPTKVGAKIELFAKVLGAFREFD